MIPNEYTSEAAVLVVSRRKSLQRNKIRLDRSKMTVDRPWTIK